jgi:hypothetical protein
MLLLDLLKFSLFRTVIWFLLLFFIFNLSFEVFSSSSSLLELLKSLILSFPISLIQFFFCLIYCPPILYSDDIGFKEDSDLKKISLDASLDLNCILRLKFLGLFIISNTFERWFINYQIFYFYYISLIKNYI